MTVIAVNKLKEKYIKDFNKYRNQLYKGYKADYYMLLRMITVIEHPDYFSEQVYQYLVSI